MAEAIETTVQTDLPPITEVASQSLFSRPKKAIYGSPDYQTNTNRLTIEKEIRNLVFSSDLPQAEQEEKVIDLAHSNFYKKHDLFATAMAIARWTRQASLARIVPDITKSPTPAERQQALIIEAQMRDEIINKAGLPADLFEANGFLEPLKQRQAGKND